MKKAESIFKDRVLRDLKPLESIYFLKTQERARRGVPDILGCIKGRFFALELKTDVGKLDVLQARTIEKIRLAGGFVLVTTPSSWATDFALLKEAFCK